MRHNKSTESIIKRMKESKPPMKQARQLFKWPNPLIKMMAEITKTFGFWLLSIFYRMGIAGFMSTGIDERGIMGNSVPLLEL